MLLPEVLSPKGQPITASLAKRYLNSGSQGALRHMLSGWAHAQRSTVREWEQHEDDVKKNQ